MKKLIFKILGAWLAFTAIGIAAHYTVGWEELSHAIYVNAVLVPLYYIYQYRKATKDSGEKMNGSRAQSHWGVFSGFSWNERSKFTLYGSLWVWMFCGTAAFLLAEAGRLETVALAVLIFLSVVLPAILFIISRRMKYDNTTGSSFFGPVKWDDQSRAVFYGTVKMWIRVASLALILYLLELWLSVTQIIVYALAAFSPLYFFLRTKILNGAES